MSWSEIVEIDYDEFIRETEKAWLLVIEGDKHWIPKSQGEIEKERQQVRISKWLAEEKDLI